MIRKRNGMRVLGLCLVALGLLAFGASAAQAEIPEWMVKGKSINEKENPTLLPGTRIRTTHAELLTFIAGVHVEILCKKTESVTGHLRTTGRILGRIRFKECVTYLNDLAHSKVSAPCEPHEGAEKGVVLTTEGEGQLGLHEGKIPVTVIKPKVGNTFAVIHTSEECAIGEEIPIIGTFAVKDISGEKGADATEKELKVHKIEEFVPLTKLYAISETKEHEAKIIGEAEVELESEEIWSGLPG